jgi:Rab-like protein 2
MSSKDEVADPNMVPEDGSPADVKIILLGDSAVGKSKLVERFLMDDYVPRQLSTFALTVFRHKGEVDGKTVEVDFWDTAGQERFASMHPSYYHRAHACILVFDVTRKVTYKNLNLWYKELQQYRKGIPTVVVANKVDVDYKVTEKSFAFATKRKLPFYFCSAADGTNVKKCFEDAIASGVNYRANPPPDFTEDVMRTLDYFDEQEKEKKEKEKAQKDKDTKDKGEK